MTVQVNPIYDGRILQVEVQGKLSTEDYEIWLPVLEKLVETHGKLRMLFHMKDFHGWTAGALWEDIKFDAKHFKDIERLAMVGDKAWQKGMTVFCKPFTFAKIRYFHEVDGGLEEARQWLLEGFPAESRAAADTGKS